MLAPLPGYTHLANQRAPAIIYYIMPSVIGGLFFLGTLGDIYKQS